MNGGRWRTLISGPMSGAANMALDEALMDRARRTSERVFRVYGWSAPTLSLGRHQAARGRIDASVARAMGVQLVRRPTGGRALLHHREVTYSVTAPLARGESVRDWYEGINLVLLQGLRALGVSASAAKATGRPPAPGTASCFVRADEGEISVAGRKLVGSALLRQADVLLQHGSILLEDDQGLLEHLLPADEIRPAPAGTIREALGRVPDANEIATALFEALRTAGTEECAPLARDPLLELRAVEAERKYGSEAWTFRT
jgi:lipoate-protein ligase A